MNKRLLIIIGVILFSIFPSADYAYAVNKLVNTSGTSTLSENTPSAIDYSYLRFGPTLNKILSWDSHSGLDEDGAYTFDDDLILEENLEIASGGIININGLELTNANGSIDADAIEDGSTNVIINATQETQFGTAYTHSQVTSGNPHAISLDDGYDSSSLISLDNGALDMNVTGDGDRDVAGIDMDVASSAEGDIIAQFDVNWRSNKGSSMDLSTFSINRTSDMNSEAGNSRGSILFLSDLITNPSSGIYDTVTLNMKKDDNGIGDFIRSEYNSDEVFTVGYDGKTGIGVIAAGAPEDPLHIKTDSGGDAIHLEENSGTEDWQLGVDVDGDLNFENEGTIAFSLEDSGGAKLTPLDTPPTAIAGAFYVDHADNKMKYYDGSNWIPMTGEDLGYLSVTTLSDSTANAAEYDIFQSSSYSAYVENTNWEHNVTASNITYTPSTGRFTVSDAGKYRIDLAMYFLAGNLSTIDLNINGVTEYTVEPYIHGSVDPVERSISIIRELSASDYIEVTIDGAAATSAQNGTTMTIQEIEDFTTGGGLLGDIVSDDDGDTKIQTEESSDEDEIRFDTAGSERMVIDSSGDVSFTGDVSTASGKGYSYNGGTVMNNFVSVAPDAQSTWALENSTASDLGYTTLDLTAYTSSTATAASICTIIRDPQASTADEIFLTVRKYGLSTPDWRDVSHENHTGSSVYNTLCGLVQMDTSQRIEYSFKDAGGGGDGEIFINVNGYIEPTT